jgi:pyruvate dehydrogenase E1 component alpha subunit
MDCLKNFRASVAGDSSFSDADLNSIDDEVLTLIEEAVTEARAAPPPPASEITADVYISYA